MDNTGETLRSRRAALNVDQKRANIMTKIQQEYNEMKGLHVTQVEHKNIMLIGRTRTGKSTLKSLLVDPTCVAEEMTLKAGTRDPVFESFYMRDKNIVLNIIDTPGLFEHGSGEIDVRDNETILQTISICANREITKFHVICFCMAITAGVNQEDINSLKLLAKFLGEDVSRNSCLIITRCESISDNRRKKIALELKQDSHFREIATFFQLGIFFSGVLNYDDFNSGSENLYEQYFTATDYRKALIELFTKNIEPFMITDMLISDSRRILREETEKDAEIQRLRQERERQEVVIKQMKDAMHNGRRNFDEVMKEGKKISMESASAAKDRHNPPSCFLS